MHFRTNIEAIIHAPGQMYKNQARLSKLLMLTLIAQFRSLGLWAVVIFHVSGNCIGLGSCTNTNTVSIFPCPLWPLLSLLLASRGFHLVVFGFQWTMGVGIQVWTIESHYFILYSGTLKLWYTIFSSAYADQSKNCHLLYTTAVYVLVLVADRVVANITADV